MAKAPAQPAAKAHHERVEARADQIWESEGRPDGCHLDHWRQAETEVSASPSTRSSAIKGNPAPDKQLSRAKSKT